MPRTHAPDDDLNWDTDRRLDKESEQRERPVRSRPVAPLAERIAAARAESELCPSSCGADGSCDAEHCERPAVIA